MKNNINTKTLSKIIIANKIFIVMQIILLISSVIFSFTSVEFAEIITCFIHVGFFVFYNIVIENYVEYGYLRKKYAKICDEVHALRYIKRKRRIYTTAKNNNDKVTTTVMFQTFLKTMLLIINLIYLLFTVTIS